MNLIQIMSRSNAANEAFKRSIMEMGGYEAFTTFYGDLTIADLTAQVYNPKEIQKYTEKYVRDTYKRVIKSWLSNIKYITEFCICLNWKIWEHYQTNEPLARVYDELWKDCQEKIEKKYAKDKEALSYYYEVTD